MVIQTSYYELQEGENISCFRDKEIRVHFVLKEKPRKSIYSLQQVENHHFSCDLSPLKTF